MAKKMTKAELIECAKKKGIKVSDKMTKADIWRLIAPVLSETPVIDGMQATAPVEEETVVEPEAEAVEEKPAVLSLDSIPIAPRVSNDPLNCDGCRANFDPAVMKTCSICNKEFCPNCAKPGTCHKCGKKL
jgi:hypothetical protein